MEHMVMITDYFKPGCLLPIPADLHLKSRFETRCQCCATNLGIQTLLINSDLIFANNSGNFAKNAYFLRSR